MRTTMKRTFMNMFRYFFINKFTFMNTSTSILMDVSMNTSKQDMWWWWWWQVRMAPGG